MKIMAFTPAKNIYYNNYKPTFGTTNRHYSTYDGYIGTNTWLFRDDIHWEKLVEYEKKHFANSDKVNIIQFASSDGSEAYTKIMTFLENNYTPNDEKFFPIKAYDIDTEVVKAANSGYLNTVTFDRINLQLYTDDYTKYFNITDKKLNILNDEPGKNTKTLQAANILRNRVQFYNADMYKVLGKLEDKGNTILMCRNILGYFPEDEIELFVKLVSLKLKKDSLFIIGEHDTRHSHIKRYADENGFLQVMKHVYKKL